MPSRLLPCLSILMCSLVLLAVGCGGGANVVPVKGKVHKSGKDVTVTDKKGLIFVTFVPESDKLNKYSAEVTSTGAFEVKGKEGKGIPPGKYKIAVVVIDPYTGEFSLAKDQFKGQFSEDKTTITREVKAGEAVDVDLDKP